MYLLTYHSFVSGSYWWNDLLKWKNLVGLPMPLTPGWKEVWVSFSFHGVFINTQGYRVMMKSKERELQHKSWHSVLSSCGPGESQRNPITALTDPVVWFLWEASFVFVSDFCLKNILITRYTGRLTWGGGRVRVQKMSWGETILLFIFLCLDQSIRDEFSIY